MNILLPLLAIDLAHERTMHSVERIVAYTIFAAAIYVGLCGAVAWWRAGK